MAIRLVLWALSADAVDHANPCAMTSVEEFEFCCCSRQTYCWGTWGWSNFEKCCEIKLCPVDSQVVLHERTPWQRLPKAVNETLAVYQRGSSTGSVLDILNCELQLEWRDFRIKLQEHVSELKKGYLRYLPVELTAMAHNLIGLHNLSQPNGGTDFFARVSFEYFQMFPKLAYLQSDTLMPEEMFCMFGYMSAAFISALHSKDRRFLQEASYFIEASGLQELDISSSTSWPIGFWDLQLNLGPGRPHHLQPISSFVPDLVRSQPMSLRSLTERAQRRSTEQLKVVVTVHHPALDLELVGALADLFSLQITLAFLRQMSSYTKSNMESHVCASWPAWCQAPHAARTLSEGPPPDADLSLCSVLPGRNDVPFHRSYSGFS